MLDDRRHRTWLYDQLPLWQSKGWIDEKAAANIRANYGPAEDTDPRRLIGTILPIAATLLIGAGIILILAHNWDELSRPLRAIISLLPLLASYALCGYTLARKTGSQPWRESSAVANFAALAAAIALVGQTYNIPGNLAHYLLALSILALPAIYLFRSKATAILYLVTITVGRWSSIDTSPDWQSYALYWTSLAALAPFLVQRIRAAGKGTTLLTRGLAISIAVAMPPLGIDAWGAIAAYSMYCATIVALAALDPEHRRIGPLLIFIVYGGLLAILLVCGFRFAWTESVLSEVGARPTVITLLGILAAANIAALVASWEKAGMHQRFWALLGLLLILLRLVTKDMPELHAATLALIANAIAISAGVVTFISGFRRGSMPIINAGMLVVGATLLCRFFDSYLPFAARGIAFIVIGAAFLVINLKLVRKFRKERAK